ncbi:MAG: fatty acid--CoA ligase family protein [Desulfopila sp.]|jgi:acyl-coenzyme A synthetase/AMP-(fatty) acid ligase|nr:fatty acid--CoA ligase family protein [Desulfopila sp.]
MIADRTTDIQRSVEDLLQGPRFPEKEYCRGVTFADVYSMAMELRHALNEPGVRPDCVCLAVEDKAVMAATLLAVLGGGPPLLLPYAFSPGVLLDLRRTTGFANAVADPSLELPDGVRTVHFHSGDTVRNPVQAEVAPHAELLRIFTGGSTGTPRIWSKTIENIFGEALFLARSYRITEQDCLLATVPPYHIYGLLFSVVLPLVASAAVVDATPSFPGEISAAAEEHGATVLISVPPHYRVLQQQKLQIRLAFSSAGMLDLEDNRRFCRNNRVPVVEVYGSTETGGIAARNRFDGEEHFTPFATVCCKIVDDRLAVRSPYVSPQLPVDGEGYYVTGDRVKGYADGRFSLQGRADKVTKVGGKRVDLDHISSVIKKMTGVVDCVVTALPDTGGRGHRIGALVQGEELDVTFIQKNLAEYLESYMLPRRIKKVERIPVSRNGKYDWNTIISLLDV